MTTEQTIRVESRCTRPALSSAALADYWTLTKPDINLLIAITTFAGFFLGYAAPLDDFPVLRLIQTLVGTLLVAAGTGTLNQYIEREFDSEMRRTARRPVASGRIKASSAFWFGIVLSVTGSVYLAVAVNALAGMLVVFTLLSYLFVYTPLKRRTPLCTLVGAVPGAMPPLIGWAAAHGSLSPAAWMLYGVLFLWQFPHFMAIAWMYRDDYDRAGYRVLPRGRARAPFVVTQTILPLVLLIVVSLVASPAQRGFLYAGGTLILGFGFLYYGVQFVIHRSGNYARTLLFASIVYLPLLLLWMVFERA